AVVRVGRHDGGARREVLDPKREREEAAQGQHQDDAHQVEEADALVIGGHDPRADAQRDGQIARALLMGRLARDGGGGGHGVILTASAAGAGGTSRSVLMYSTRAPTSGGSRTPR